ncbi:MAG: aldo/keto reductase [Myxococcota bacterium]
MQYRRLGKSGLKLSALSLGSWLTFSKQVDKDIAKQLLRCAHESGINFFDNAEVYASGDSETIMGEALQDLQLPRDAYCVSSKVFWGGQLPTQRGLSRKHITEACHGALRRLRVDYLDLYFCHRPDQNTPLEETVWAMHHLIQQGKVLYWGTSEWSAQEIASAHAAARQYNLIPPTMEQPQYNMFHRQKLEREYLRLFRDEGLGTTIWSPLAGGILTGKYNKEIPKGSRASLGGHEWIRKRLESKEGRQQIDQVAALQRVTKRLGCTMAQLALAWCLRNPHVSTVILGASKVDQLQENLQCLDVVDKLDEGIMHTVDTILQNRPEPIEEF